MANLKKHKKILHAGVFFWLSIFLLAPISCKNTTGPDDEITTAKITVSNECGVAVDIYMDKIFQFSVEYLESKTIQNLSLGEHEFEAKREGTEIFEAKKVSDGSIVASISIDFAENKAYFWTINK